MTGAGAGGGAGGGCHLGNKRVSKGCVEWCCWGLVEGSAGPGGGLWLVLAHGAAVLLLLQKHLVMEELELDRVPAKEHNQRVKPCECTEYVEAQ